MWRGGRGPGLGARRRGGGGEAGRPPRPPGGGGASLGAGDIATAYQRRLDEMGRTVQQVLASNGSLQAEVANRREAMAAMEADLSLADETITLLDRWRHLGNKLKVDTQQMELWLDSLDLAVPIRGVGEIVKDFEVPLSRGRRAHLRQGDRVVVAYSKGERVCIWWKGAQPLVAPKHVVREVVAVAAPGADAPEPETSLEQDFMGQPLFRKITALVVKLFDVQQQLTARKALEARSKKGPGSSSAVRESALRRASMDGAPPGSPRPQSAVGSPRPSSPATPRSSTGGFEAGEGAGAVAGAEKGEVYGVNHHESQGSFEGGETSVVELQRQVLHLTRAVNELLKGNDKLSKDLATKKGRIEKLELERKALARRSEGAAAAAPAGGGGHIEDTQQQLQGVLQLVADKEREMMALKTQVDERESSARQAQVEIERLIEANEAAQAQAVQSGELLQREVATSAGLQLTIQQLTGDVRQLRSELLQEAESKDRSSAEMARLQGRVQQLEYEKTSVAAEAAVAVTEDLKTQVAVTASGASESPQVDLAPENTNLQQELASKEEEAASLADQLRDERALIKSLQQRLAAFQRRSLEDSSDTDSSEADSGRAPPKHEIQQLREAKERFEVEMAALRGFLEQSEEENRARGEVIEGLREQVAELKGAMAAEREALEKQGLRDGERTREDLEALRVQLLAAEAQLVTANTARNDAILYSDSLGADVEELRNEREEAQQELGRSKAQRGDLEARLKETVALVGAGKQRELELLREHDRLREACENMEGEAAEHRDEVGRLGRRLATAAAESAAANAEVSRLEAEVTSLAPPPYSELTMYERLQVLARSEWFQQVGRVVLENLVAVAGTLSFVPPFSHYCPVSVKIAAALAGACVILSWVRVLGGYEPSRAAVRGGSGSGLVGRKAPALGIAVQDLNLVTPDASPTESPERPRRRGARRSVTFNPLCDESLELATPQGRENTSFQVATPRSAASSTGGMAELSWTALDTDTEGSPGPSGCKPPVSALFASPSRPSSHKRRWGAGASSASKNPVASPLAPDLAWEAASAANAELAERSYELDEARAQAGEWQRSVQALTKELSEKQAALEDQVRQATTARGELDVARSRAVELEVALWEQQQESAERVGALVGAAAGDAAYEALALKCSRREAELGEARQESGALQRRLGALQMKLRTTEERLSNLSNSQVALGLDVEALAKELAARSEALREESRRGEAARARCSELEAALSERAERSGDWDTARARLDAQAVDLKAAHRDLRLQEEALERARSEAKGARAEAQVHEERIAELEINAAMARKDEGERRRDAEARGAGELRRVRAEAAAAVEELRELQGAHRALAASKEGLLGLLRSSEARILELERDTESLRTAADVAAAGAGRAAAEARDSGAAEHERLKAAAKVANGRAETAERVLFELKEEASAASAATAQRVAELEDRLSKSKRELGELVRKYEEELSTQGEEVRSLSAALAEAKTQAAALRRGFETRGMELEERRFEGQTLARALDARSAELEALRSAKSNKLLCSDAEVQVQDSAVDASPAPPPPPPPLRAAEDIPVVPPGSVAAAQPVVNPLLMPALPQGVTPAPVDLRENETAAQSPSVEDRLAEEGFSFARLEQQLQRTPGDVLLLSNLGATTPRAGHKRSASGGDGEGGVGEKALADCLRTVEAEAFQMQERIQRLLDDSSEPLRSPLPGPLELQREEPESAQN